MAFGADFDLVDNNGQTPIYYAIKGSRLDVIEYLLQGGINFNNTDKNRLTPYAWAKRANKPQIIEILRKYNAIPDNDQSAQKNVNKKQAQSTPAQPPKARVNERKNPKRFQLTTLRDGQYEPISEEEWVKFCQENPDLAQYFEATEGA